MLLQFITEPKIGAKERRIIRSHVMKGKNAGRPRSSRRRLHNTSASNQSSEQSMLPRVDQLSENYLEALDYKHNLDLKRILWNDLILPSFPEHMSPDHRNFIYKCAKSILVALTLILYADQSKGLWITAKGLYPQEFCSEVDLSQYVWFQYVLEDKACKTQLHTL